MVFGHSVGGPLKLLKENGLSESLNLLDYVSKLIYKLKKACELAQQNLKNSQLKMKMLYDTKSQNRIFKPGDKVLVLLPVQGNTLEATYHEHEDHEDRCYQVTLEIQVSVSECP